LKALTALFLELRQVLLTNGKALAVWVFKFDNYFNKLKRPLTASISVEDQKVKGFVETGLGLRTVAKVGL
jgi:hypothetical protein